MAIGRSTLLSLFAVVTLNSNTAAGVATWVIRRDYGDKFCLQLATAPTTIQLDKCNELTDTSSNQYSMADGGVNVTTYSTADCSGTPTSSTSYDLNNCAPSTDSAVQISQKTVTRYYTVNTYSSTDCSGPVSEVNAYESATTDTFSNPELTTSSATYTIGSTCLAGDDSASSTKLIEVVWDGSVYAEPAVASGGFQHKPAHAVSSMLVLLGAALLALERGLA